MSRVRSWAAIVLTLAGIALTLSGCLGISPGPVTVTAEQAARALTVAKSKVGAPYVYGGRGPDAFDCSGLITWAYKQAVPGIGFKQWDGSVADDADMELLYSRGCQAIPPEEVRPGDVVVMTDGQEAISHGGLVVSLSGDTVTFINASSAHGSVTMDQWPLHEWKRGQKIIGFGRVLYFPLR